MNLRSFLTQVDTITGQMSEAQLKEFIHENARLLPESKRMDYLGKLKCALSEPLDAGWSKKNADEVFKKEFASIQKDIYKIEEGDLYLEGEINYEYDEWYDNGDEEVIFLDPHGIGDIIERACRFIHKCIDCEEYAYGYKIAKRLIGLDIRTQREEWDSYYDFLSMGDLEYHDLIEIDYKQVVIDGLYLAYQGNALEDRAEAMYRMIEKSHLQDITLETVMQNGEELTDITEFLSVWIAYLGQLSSVTAQKLLKEALELMGDPELFLSNARQFYNLHPALYEQYLDSAWNTQDSKKLFEIGNEALEKINTKYVVRSRIAKRLSLLALEEQKKDKAERYWLETFRSETTVTNYMRIYIESADRNVFLEQMRKIYYQMYGKSGNSLFRHEQEGELKINNPDFNTVYMLAFLGGEFEYIKQHAMNVKGALGWSSTFMKCGLSAFLLLLMDCDELLEGGKEMCRRVVSEVDFDKEEYQRWSNKQNDLSSQELFWKCFKKWKENVEISEAQRQEYFRWIEQLIKKRVNGIMEANRRNYYWECASYIAALGEALETHGQQGAKLRILFEYKKMYSRRWNFHEQLREYGMPDTRK